MYYNFSVIQINDLLTNFIERVSRSLYLLEKHDRNPKPARLDVEAVERHVEVQKS